MFFRCQCTLKSTGQRISGEPASPRWTRGRSFPSRPSPDSLALRKGSPRLRRISLAGGAPRQILLAVGSNKRTCRSLWGDFIRKHHSRVRSPRSPLPRLQRPRSLLAAILMTSHTHTLVLPLPRPYEWGEPAGSNTHTHTLIPSFHCFYLL